MIPITYNVDYLTVVMDLMTSSIVGYKNYVFDWTPVFGRYGYDIAHLDERSGIVRLSSSTRQDMGVCYVLTAQVLDRIAKIAKTPDRLAACKLWGLDYGRATRVDLCMDYYDGGMMTYIIADNLRAGLIRTTAKKFLIVESVPVGNGLTVYLGARTSSLFIRVYDKSAESRGKINSTRFEVECKSDAARAIWQGLTSAIKPIDVQDMVLGCFLGLWLRGDKVRLTRFSTE